MKVSPGIDPRPPRPVEETPPQGPGAPRSTGSAVSGLALRGVVFSVVDQVIVSGTSFATSVVVGRICSQAEFGVYYLGLSFVLFFRDVQGEFISAPYVIYCHRRRGQALAAYTGSTLVHQVFLSALAMACLLGLAGVLSPGAGPTGLAPAAWVLVGAIPLLLLRERIRQLAFSHLRLATAIAIDSGVAILQLSSLLLLAYARVLTAGAVYGVMGAACALPCLAWFLANKPHLRFLPSQVKADWCHNWSFAKWTLASYLVGSTTPYITPWLVALAHGEAATGVWAACNTLVNGSNIFVVGLANFLTPKAARAFAKGGLRDLRRVLWKTAALFATTLGAFCLLMLVAGDLPAVWVYGGQYTGTGPVLVVLALNTLATSLGITAGNGLWAIERPQANFAADLCTFVVTVAMALALVHPLGVLGAAIAALAGSTLGVAVRCLTLVRLTAAVRYASRPA